MAPISDIALVNPRHWDSPPADDDLVSFVPMAQVQEETGLLSAETERPAREVMKGYTRFQENDLLLAKITPCMENGKFAIARGLREGRGAGSTEFHVLRPHDGVSARYLLHFFLQPDFRKHARMNMQGAAGQLRIKKNFVEETLIPLPPTAEQARIVEAIESHVSRIFSSIETFRATRAKLAAYRAAVLRAACEGRLVPTEAELARAEGPPKHWQQVTLGEISDIQGGITLGKKRRPDEKTSPVPYLRVANVQRLALDLSEVKEVEATQTEVERLALRSGDVLFNEGGDRDKLGRGWIWNNQIPMCIHQNHVFRARVDASRAVPKYVSFYGNSVAQKYFWDEGKHTTNMASINRTKLSALPIPLPPIGEQQMIVAEVERHLSVVERLESAIDENLFRASRLRQAILKRAFEGRLVQQDPRDEPAIVLLARIKKEREAAGATIAPRKRAK